MDTPPLVFIDEYGILGSNFYWHKYEAKGLTKDDILSAGLTNDRVQVHKDIIEPLQAVNTEFQKRGYRLYIKEGYRSKALYDMVYQRRVEKFGQEETDKLFNMNDMPHAQGLSVDVALWNVANDTEKYMRNGDDGTEALFIDFYKGKEGEKSKEYQELQEWVIDTMHRHGFCIGTRREYFHFDFRSPVLNGQV